jgi:hypothetical protein
VPANGSLKGKIMPMVKCPDCKRTAQCYAVLINNDGVPYILYKRICKCFSSIEIGLLLYLKSAKPVICPFCKKAHFRHKKPPQIKIK